MLTEPTTIGCTGMRKTNGERGKRKGGEKEMRMKSLVVILGEEWKERERDKEGEAGEGERERESGTRRRESEKPQLNMGVGVRMAVSNSTNETVSCNPQNAFKKERRGEGR